jgi:hypothetical protein
MYVHTIHKIIRKRNSTLRIVQYEVPNIHVLNISFLQIICFFCFNPKAQGSAVRLVERSLDNKNGYVQDKSGYQNIDFYYTLSFENNIYIAGAVSRDRVRLDVYGTNRVENLYNVQEPESF